MTNESFQKSHTCEYCNKSFSTSSDLKKHVRTHTGERPYECGDCGARFTQCGGLKNHIVSRHTSSGDPFLCHYCKKKFPIKERLRLHLRTHTGERPYACPDCPKRFARGGQLAQHRRIHTGARPYSCSHCPQQFTCLTNLSVHLKRHSGERDHVCHICGKSFVRRDELRKHVACLHKGVLAFRCKICNKRFKGHLVQHLRTHLREKPHSCGVCGASFAQSSQLKVHQRTHSGEKPYICQICLQTFAYSTALKMHIRRHTGEKPFKCLLCPSASFVQLPHLKKHMLCIHKTSKPYFCTGCRKFFKTKNELNTHQQECTVQESSSEGSGESMKINYVSVPVMALNKMRMLLAILLKRISTQDRLEALGFGKRLIDDVLQDSIESSGRKACLEQDLDEAERLKKNVEILLEWTVPQKYMEKFRSERRSTEELLEDLAS